MVARQGLADDDEYENIFKGLEKEFDKALLECIVRIGKTMHIAGRQRY